MSTDRAYFITRSHKGLPTPRTLRSRWAKRSCESGPGAALASRICQMAVDRTRCGGAEGVSGAKWNTVTVYDKLSLTPGAGISTGWPGCPS